MRLFLLTTFAAALTLSHASAQVPAQNPAPAAPPIPAELMKLQGNWKCQSIVYDGEEKMGDPKQRDVLTLVAKGAEYRMYCLTDPVKNLHIRLFTGEIALDAATNTFTLTVTDGREKGKKVHGVYELTKEGFKTCYGPADKPRPVKFEAAKDSGLFVESWKVEAPKPAAAGLGKVAGAP